MRSLVLVLGVVAACASGRHGGVGDDDDDGADDSADAARGDATAAITDAATGTIDAEYIGDAWGTGVDADPSVVPPCSDGLELIGQWLAANGTTPIRSPVSLAIGPAGELVTLFNTDVAPFKVAQRLVDGTWPAETIDPTGGSHASVVIAPDRTIYACFIDAPPHTRGPLVCMRKPLGGVWTGGIVDVNGAYWPSVALVPSGLVVTYGRADGLGMAWQSSGGGWSISVPATGDVRASSIAVDPQGNPHVVYVVYDTTWRVMELGAGLIDGNGAWVTPRSLAIDSSGRLHLVFHTSTSGGEPIYAYRDPGGAWIKEHDIDGNDGIPEPGSFSLAVIPDGEVHISYQTQSGSVSAPKQIRHAMRTTAGVWTTAVVHEMPGYYPNTTAIATHASDVHIVFERPLFGPSPVPRQIFHIARCGPSLPN